MYAVPPAAPPAGPVRRRAGVLASAVLVAGLVGVLFAGPALTAPATAAPAGGAATARVWAQKMLVWLNAERTVHGRAPLRLDGELVRSAHRHNLAMARARLMSHQVPGEPGLAARLDGVGYQFLRAGENVGYSTRETVGGLRALQRQMYHEPAPDNGHRLNILSRAYRQVGIDVYFDGRGTMWFTQDFGVAS
jgi:uncharacterized protein YkwD